MREPAFYSYTAPEPEGLTDQPLNAEGASWQEGGTALLTYEAVRNSESPKKTLLNFLQSAYEAGAKTADWDAEGYDTRPGHLIPTPEQNAVVQRQMEELHALHLTLGDEQVVRYYPPEMEAEAHRFGIAFTHVDGTRFHYGDCEYAFPLHSISKVFIYALALEDNGREETLRHVGVEPSGDPYNSITFDEKNNRPFNPMINAGALVATSLVHGKDRDEKVGRLLERLRIYAGNPGLHVDKDLLAEELVSNDRNLGLSYLMRSLGMLDGDLYENLAVYLSDLLGAGHRPRPSEHGRHDGPRLRKPHDRRAGAPQISGAGRDHGDAHVWHV